MSACVQAELKNDALRNEATVLEQEVASHREQREQLTHEIQAAQKRLADLNAAADAARRDATAEKAKRANAEVCAALPCVANRRG